MSAAAIILSAGESRRMGRPKALLPFRGGTFLSTLAETMGRHCSPTIAVFGFDGDRVARFAPPSVVPVVNRDYRLGMLTSLQAGLRALGDIAGPVLFTPVDHPAILPGTVAALLRTEAEIAIPRFGGKRGHPVLLGARMAREFLTEPLSSKVRDPIDRHAAEIRYIEVEDPGINDDIDDPALYAALLDRESSRLTGDSL